VVVDAVAYVENFHGGVSFNGIWWSFAFGVRFLWRHNLTSYSSFEAKFVDIIGIFFYTHSPNFCKNQALYIPLVIKFLQNIKLKGGFNPQTPPCVDEMPLYNQSIPPVLYEHLSIWFQVSSKKWRLEINEFRSYCDVHISYRFVFFCSSFFCFNNTNTSVGSFIFFPCRFTALYTKCKGPLSKFQPGAPHNLNPPLLFTVISCKLFYIRFWEEEQYKPKTTGALTFLVCGRVSSLSFVQRTFDWDGWNVFFCRGRCRDWGAIGPQVGMPSFLRPYLLLIY